METATIEVKYVNPPKAGKQYGSIKGTDNDTWPVKKDRIAEFEPGSKYELAYTLGNGDFRNIIGVKKIAPEAAPLHQGQFEQFSDHTPRNGATLTPSAGPKPAAAPANNFYRPTAPRDSERMWCCATLGHFIDRGAVALNAGDLTDAVNVLRAVYAATFGADDAPDRH